MRVASCKDGETLEKRPEERPRVENKQGQITGIQPPGRYSESLFSPRLTLAGFAFTVQSRRSSIQSAKNPGSMVVLSMLQLMGAGW